MALPRRSSAERAAHVLLAELGIKAIPVPLDKIADLIGARVIRQRMEGDVSGMTYRHNGEVIIGLNAVHHSKRQRFTQAHEIGHIRLHPGRPLTVDSSVRVNFRDAISSQATDNEEIEANAFAAALLMPRAAVIHNAERLQSEGIRSRDKLILELSKVFDVSPEAMGYRLVNLGVTSSP